MLIKNIFETLPDSSKNRLKIYLNKAYKKSILIGKGFEVSDIMYKLYSDENELNEPATENYNNIKYLSH